MELTLSKKIGNIVTKIDYYWFGGYVMKWNDINIQFGNVLRKIREGRKMTQEEFAELCDISRAYYGRIERGEHSVTLELCRKISEATGLSLAEIFEDIT